MWEYEVVPFSAAIRAGANRAASAAKQFHDLLQEMEGKGLEYYRMDHYSLVEQPGCLAGLFGAKASVITYDVAVFRRRK